jgi:hypothetical protein
MSDWKVFYRDDHRRDAQSTHTSKEAAIVQALHLERRQHCRIQIIEGQNGELIDRGTFEREHLKRPPRYLRALVGASSTRDHQPRQAEKIGPEKQKFGGSKQGCGDFCPLNLPAPPTLGGVTVNGK